MPNAAVAAYRDRMAAAPAVQEKAAGPVIREAPGG